MAEKSPYKLVVKFEGARPERIAEALAELREIAAVYDQTGESTATMVIESWQEAPLRETMDAFEVWLYRHAPGLVPDRGMVLYRPGLRPETAEMLAREKKKTPMDQQGWEKAEPEEGPSEQEVLITPPPVEPLVLPAAGETGETVECEYAVDDGWPHHGDPEQLAIDVEQGDEEGVSDWAGEEDEPISGDTIGARAVDWLVAREG
jgi:hypothetical protein